MKTITIDLGCGGSPGNPFHADIVYGLDLEPDIEKNILGADLTIDPIPFGENFFDFITASHLLEHIPRVIYMPTRRNPFVEVMNEIWRTLKPGGKFLSATPAIPHLEVFQDPTHVNYITEKTFSEYCLAPNAYGFYGRFELEQQNWSGYNLFTLLRKIPN